MNQAYIYIVFFAGAAVSIIASIIWQVRFHRRKPTIKKDDTVKKQKKRLRIVHLTGSIVMGVVALSQIRSMRFPLLILSFAFIVPLTSVAIGAFAPPEMDVRGQ